MGQLGVSDFPGFFEELHGCEPYDWQLKLAELAAQGQWPGAVDLPTGCGKTACIDIAIFALACQANLQAEKRLAPRRIFFCVNRRIIVDEAFQRARRIAEALWRADVDSTVNDSPVARVAEALRVVAGTQEDSTSPPLDAMELRGGIHNDSRWARSITQPSVVCTTLDQLGSRLLFRGYGTTRNSAPIQSALIAYDSLILLDEAHISEPFRQTLEQIRGFVGDAKWAEAPIDMHSFVLVPMTATPNETMVKQGVVELTATDRKNRNLQPRLTTSKPAELRFCSSVLKESLAITELLKAQQPLAIGIIVNRITTAKEIYQTLIEQAGESDETEPQPPDIELVIGSMRPLDRDAQVKGLDSVVGPNRPPQTDKTIIVVATQCLEVGADYDFDVLISECASLDALRQRMGRLNRSGRKIDAEAFILVNKNDIKPENRLNDDKPLDPIYGNSLARTWNWLQHVASDGFVDFGTDAFNELVVAHGTKVGKIPGELLAPSASKDAPIMLPAYLDLWCQTAPRPNPDPDVSLFIHGTNEVDLDIQVCWRSDLSGPMETWCDVVSLVPPTSAECISIPISRFRRWLRKSGDPLGGESDVFGNRIDVEEDSIESDRRQCKGVIWRGSEDSKLLTNTRDVRPGDTVVLPTTLIDSVELCHFPGRTADDQISDLAEIAFLRSRDRAILRVHESTRGLLPEGASLDALFRTAANSEESPSINSWQRLLYEAQSEMARSSPERRSIFEHLANANLRVERYPDDQGVVLSAPKRLGSSANWFIRSMDEGDDEGSRVLSNEPITLSNHGSHVKSVARVAMECLGKSGLKEAIEIAASHHDWGKADERFQAMLRRTDRTDSWLLAGANALILAKSDAVPRTRKERQAAQERAQLPSGFRHEMLSTQLAEHSDDVRHHEEGDLILHLIASHHGYARPLAPVVDDEEFPAVEFAGISLSHDERSNLIASHRLDSGIADRFWKLTKRYGWWGVAYLEALLRLADQQASAMEQAGLFTEETLK